jgi:hypothetical protein
VRLRYMGFDFAKIMGEFWIREFVPFSLVTSSSCQYSNAVILLLTVALLSFEWCS